MHENVKFPKNYSIFALEYSLTYSRVNILDLPKTNFNLVYFCKPPFNPLYYTIDVVGCLLGDEGSFEEKMLYEFNCERNIFVKILYNGEGINVVDSKA